MVAVGVVVMSVDEELIRRAQAAVLRWLADELSGPPAEIEHICLGWIRGYADDVESGELTVRLDYEQTGTVPPGAVSMWG